jgi:CRISPR/Cas system CSM-associated protein Csm2 small subunit
MLKLLRALCLICFLLSAILLIASFTDHKLFKHPILIPAIVALSLFFLVWYLLPIFLEKMEATLANIDHMKRLRVQNAALKLELQKLKCLYDDSKERFVQKDKQFRKSFMVLSVVARYLVAWEQSRGKISAEEAFISLREELRRLNIRDAEKEDM